MLTRRGAIGGAAAILFALASLVSAAPAASARSNFLLIVSDEHNPRYSSVYGHPFVRTPNLERLARRGVVYESAYCASPLCAPSRSAFMAGKRVHRLQTYNNSNLFSFDYPTYGSVLGAAGVFTAYIGKTDVFRPGRELGFSAMIDPGDRAWPGDTDVSRVPLSIRADGAQRAAGYGPMEGNPFARDDRTTDLAVEWLRGTAASLDRPWTLTVNLIKPHFPHYATRELWESYPEGDLPERGLDEESAKHPYAEDLRAHFGTEGFSEDDVRGLRRGYYACVTAMDERLGRILDAVDDLGLAENTVVAYTTDHGEMLGKFGMWWKCSLYEESVRVPLVVAGPGFPVGARTKSPVDQLDLQAAMFRATGVERPADWDGRALQDVAPDDPDRVVFAEYHGHGTRGGAFMIRRGRWKYLRYRDAPAQLFDLEDDPEELRNLAELRTEVVLELEAELRKICDPEIEQRRAEDFLRRQLERMDRR